MRRMCRDQEDIFYYITVMNENYPHPEMPEGVEQHILKGMYLFSEAGKRVKGLRVQLLGSGTILREVIAASEILKQEYGVNADVWSVTSFTELRREAMSIYRWNMLHPEKKAKTSHVENCLRGRTGPVIAATDYMKIFADQIREFVPGCYRVLGTDGFGRSDTRKKLRQFFEVDRYYITVAALKALADEGKIAKETVTQAIKQFEIDPEKPDPVTL